MVETETGARPEWFDFMVVSGSLGGSKAQRTPRLQIHEGAGDLFHFRDVHETNCQRDGLAHRRGAKLKA